MSARYRRVIRRPDGIDDDAWAKATSQLDDAIALQKLLARATNHVLQFTGDLEADDDTLYIEHEAASAIPAAHFHDTESTPEDTETLVDYARGLFDAIRAAHDDATPAIHGGLCPGVLLTAPDGTLKVSDFGFAPAICAALGVDAYTNLAVGRPDEAVATGVWEVLAPDVFDRTDRICAFIDPEKYGRPALHTFEAGSDIIAAGFLLHMLAERQHPYLYAEPDAHRLVEMSAFMAMGRYNGARRQDLRESTDDTVRIWCDVVGRTLSRLPARRPSAQQASQALSGDLSADEVHTLLEDTREASADTEPVETPPRKQDTKDQASSVQTPASASTGPDSSSETSRWRNLLRNKRTIGIAGGVGAVVLIILVWLLLPGDKPIDPGPAGDPTSIITEDPPRNDNATQQPPSDDTTDQPVEPENSNTAADAGTNTSPVDNDNTASATPEDGPDADTVDDAGPIVESTSTPPADDRAEPEMDEELAALVAAVNQNLDQIDTIETQLATPVHEQLAAIINEGTLSKLLVELREQAAHLPTEHDVAPTRGKVRDRIHQAQGWADRLTRYADILDMKGVPIDEQIARLQRAGETFATPHVADQLAQARRVQSIVQSATQNLNEGSWRFAAAKLKAVRAAAQAEGQAQAIESALEEASRRIIAKRRDQLQTVLPEIKQWLASVGAPPEPLIHLTMAEAATQARNKLDQLDLDLPRPRGSETDALLTADEQATVDQLVDWTQITLSVTGRDGIGQVDIPLIFIPAAQFANVLDPVWMSQTEITVGQYRAVMHVLPADPGASDAYQAMRSNEDHPIALIPAAEIKAFCDALTQRLAQKVIVRPPSTHEFKYALSAGGYELLDALPQLCRYAEDGTMSFDPTRANFESDENYVFTAPGHEDGAKFYAPVTTYPPNRWTLYGLLGNVSEWVSTDTPGRLATAGGGYRDAYTTWTDIDARPVSRDQQTAYDDVGFRIVVIPTPP